MVRLLAKGGQGYVYAMTVGNKSAAIKISKCKSVVQREAEVLRLMVNEPGFPIFIHSDNNQFVTMELLGRSLAEFRGKLTINNVLVSVARQMLARLQTLHEYGFIHRDVKPHNFVLGLGPAQRTVYMIDFGLARQYVRNGVHIYKNVECQHSLKGTRRYASTNSHMRVELSRRDDLESLAYSIAELFLTTLPWAHERDECKLLQAKLQPAQSWCPRFDRFITYSRSLAFERQPDYERCRQWLA